MAALFRMPFALPTTAAEPTTSSLAKPTQPLLQSPRSYHLPAYPNAREWDEREQRAGVATRVSSAPRIAHWDQKREKCANCKHIYLKTLSRHAGFCSVDCKSNAAYIDKVNRTIKAVRSAAQHQRERKEDAEATTQPKQQPEAEAEDEDATDMTAPQARTFAEFGLEARLPTDQHVEWAFSAMY